MAKSVTQWLAIFRKEFNGFFTSPAAWLFLGTFLAVNLFIFFWAEAFFARNLADVKPLFEWMPILLIFLVAALTMRSWSEERRAGTLESLLTSPVSPLQLVLGKFAASLALVALALLLTFPLPLTVARLGSLDWGPVFGGYLASLFLAAAYVAIGLYMSARTDNPIVALILTVVVGGIFYLLGSTVLTSLFGHQVGGLLALLGSGSRFDSITRGVLDVRDLYYYLSVTGVFLALNLLTLERLRWAGNPASSAHKRWNWVTGLAIANFVLANFWLQGVGWARADLTQGHIYSLSPATKQYMAGLQEPLLIRGYFSDKTHPLLEPLVPQIKDLLKEYQVAGGNKVQVEFVDPHTDQALESEAAEKYGIRPVPFRMASRYQSGVVNSYFNLLVSYGDQYQTLGYEDLIEVKDNGERDLEVRLKNPEYAITRAIRKVANAYQAGGNAFASLGKPVTFHAYVSPADKLPKALADLRKNLESTLDEMKQSSGGKLTVSFEDPDANGGALAKKLQDDYGYGPQIASLFDPKPFWFYMQLEGNGSTVQVPLPAELDKNSLKQAIDAGLQRMAPGFLKTVAIVTPTAPAGANQFMPPQGGKRYEQLRKTLADNVRLEDTDLKNGNVPADADLLLLLAPENLDQKQLFAVDQFLMKGGSVVVATSPFDVAIGQSLEARKNTSGLEDWLKSNGLTLADSMVLDPQNAQLPIPVPRQIGPITVDEIKMMPYPHFPDIRKAGLNADSPITSALDQLTLNWASPMTVDKAKNKGRKVTELLHSSDQSWTSTDLNVLPDYRQYPDTGFRPEDARAPELLAASVEGRFDSWFKGKQSPLLEKKADDKAGDKDKVPQDAATDPAKPDAKQEDKTVVSSIIDRSPDSARITLISSNAFASDDVLQLASQGMGTQYTRPLEFLQNVLDWSLEDQGLLSIRSRASFARTLVPMEHSAQLLWEYLNYALALLGLGGVWLWRRMVHKRTQAHYRKLLAEV
jgi:ABC-2 type transport system permease protein